MNTKTTLLALTLPLLFGVNAALALTNSFDVVVDVDKSSQEIQLTQTQAMVFPSIKVDESIKVGDWCYTNYSSSGPLCRGSTPGSDHLNKSINRITGTPFASYSLELSPFSKVNGFYFYVSYDPNSRYEKSRSSAFDASGIHDFDVFGFLALANPDEVVAGNTTFTYNITANYE